MLTPLWRLFWLFFFPLVVLADIQQKHNHSTSPSQLFVHSDEDFSSLSVTLYTTLSLDGNGHKKNSNAFFQHPTGLISHPLYHTINSSEAQEKGKDTQRTLQSNKYAHTPHPPTQSFQIYCFPKNDSYSRSTPHSPGFSLLWGTTAKEIRRPGGTDGGTLSERQHQAAVWRGNWKWGKVSEFITTQRIISCQEESSLCSRGDPVLWILGLNMTIW